MENSTEKPKKRGMRIKNPNDIKRLLNRMVNEVLNDDDIATDRKAQLIATLSNSALRSIEQSDIAERMESYKEQLDEYKQLLIESQRKKGRHR